MERNQIPLLTSENYLLWSMKIKSFLALKRITNVLNEDRPEDTKLQEDWDLKNADAVAYIVLSLSDELSIQYAEETNARILWNKIKLSFTGKTEDRKIDASNELKNLEMNDEENVSNYVARARGLATKCAALGLKISERELVFYTVRGLRGKFGKIREILKTQREKEIDELLEILREEEKNILKQNSPNAIRREAFFAKSRNQNRKTCFICKKSNHVAKNCFFRNKNGTEKPRTFFQNRGDKKKFASIAEETEEDEFALITTKRELSDCSNSVWVLDSGSSSHMCKDINFFETLENEVSDIQLAGKNSILKSVGKGKVCMKTFVDKVQKTLNVENVIYVPELRTNLLSVVKLMEKGYKIKSDKNCILILSETGKTVLKAEKVNNRLEVLMKPCINNNVSSELECNYTNDYETWHKRLCHLNPQYMSKMQNLIGLNVKEFENLNCESCDISKLTRKKHSKIDVEQSNSILELIHADLAGPIDIDSLGNSKYFLVFVDDYSGMYFSYFLKCKSDVFEVFCNFREKYENLTNKRIKRLRTDNGLEFVNKDMSKYLLKFGITHERTVPYNPESNGKAERAIRCLIERSRTLIHESELPQKFWAEAINCSTHVSNITPRKDKQKLPIELWSGKKPKVSYLKTFGCVAYYHIPKQFRNKFDVPGKRGIFLGYSRDRIAYRIYDISKGKVIEERSVKFDETIKGSKFLNKNSEPQLWNIEHLSQFNFDSETENKIQREIPTESENTGSSQNKEENAPDPVSPPPHGESLRRSERIKNKNKSKVVSNLALNLTEMRNEIPKCYDEAINSLNASAWQKAMNKELDSMTERDVFEIVKRPKNVKVIKSKWVYSIKTINDEEIYKARLVAAAYDQIKNKDYTESYSPVVHIESFRLLISLAAKLNLSVRFFDVKTAYLYGDIKETVYMEIPPGYEEQFGKNNVCKLKRSIYGLPQSGRNWHIKLKNELKRIGLNQLASDNCVFTIKSETDFLAICVYVDDLAIFSNNSKLCEEIIIKLKESFELNETTENSKFLGIEVLQDENGIKLSQTHYIESLLNKYGMENCKKANTPITKGEDRCFNPTDNLVNQTEYQEIIGEILYLANRTRPDLAFVSSYLSQFNKRPEKRHYTLAKKVLKYLNATKDKALFYDREFGFINCSADASWGNGEGGKSFSGCVIMLGKSLVTWKSRKQKFVGLSTCEVELLAIADVARELTWTLNMLSELKCEIFVNKPVIVYSDSQAAIDWLNSGKSSNKTRHINLKFHFVKDLIEDNTVTAVYKNTNEMLSDFLTKAVTCEKLLFSLDNICLK